MPRRWNAAGSAIATTVAIEQLANIASATATATSASPQPTRANARKALPITMPITRPVTSSRRSTERTVTPAASARIITVSVWVPTASAM